MLFHVPHILPSLLSPVVCYLAETSPWHLPKCSVSGHCAAIFFLMYRYPPLLPAAPTYCWAWAANLPLLLQDLIPCMSLPRCCVFKEVFSVCSGSGVPETWCSGLQLLYNFNFSCAALSLSVSYIVFLWYCLVIVLLSLCATIPIKNNTAQQAVLSLHTGNWQDQSNLK